MFATLLAALAVVIALQALRLASRDRIVIQVQPDTAPASRQSPELPPFLNKPRPAEPEARLSFQQSSPLDVHPN